MIERNHASYPSPKGSDTSPLETMQQDAVLELRSFLLIAMCDCFLLALQDLLTLITSLNSELKWFGDDSAEFSTLSR